MKILKLRPGADCRDLQLILNGTVTFIKGSRTTMLLCTQFLSPEHYITTCRGLIIVQVEQIIISTIRKLLAA